MSAIPVAPVPSAVRVKCSVTVGAVSCATPARWQVGPDRLSCDAHLATVLRVVNRLLNTEAGCAS